MGALKDIFLGPETADPEKVWNPAAAFGSGFGAGFARQFDPDAIRKKEQGELSRKKTELDIADSFIKISKMSPTMRGPMTKYLLDSLGMKKESPAYSLLLETMKKADEGDSAMMRRVFAAAGMHGVEDFRNMAESDPTKLIDFVNKLSATQAETEATNVRRGMASGEIGPETATKEGISSVPLADPKSPDALKLALANARQRAASVRGKAGEDLRKELNLGSVQSGELTGLLAARVAGEETGNPVLDAMSPKVAATIRSKVEKPHFQTYVGDKGEQGIVAVNSEGKEISRIPLPPKGINVNQYSADLMLIAAGKKPRFGRPEDYEGISEKEARKIAVDIQGMDPLKQLIGALIGDVDLEK